MSINKWDCVDKDNLSIGDKVFLNNVFNCDYYIHPLDYVEYLLDKMQRTLECIDKEWEDMGMPFDEDV